MGLFKWFWGFLLAVAAHLVALRLWPEMTTVFDPFLIFVVYHSLDREPALGVLGGAATGLAHDALTGGLFGLHGFANTLVAFTSARMQQRFVMQQPLQIGLLFALAAALQIALLSLLQYFFLTRPELPEPLPAMAKMVLNAGLGYLVYYLSHRLKIWLSKIRRQRQRKLTINTR